MVDIWAVVTTHNRHAMLANLMDDLDRDRTIIIDHDSVPPVEEKSYRTIRYTGPPNISHQWNLGLDAIYDEHDGDEFAVAVLNDDLRVPPGTLERLAEALFAEGCLIAYPDQHHLLQPGEVEVRRGQPGPINLFLRMTGYAFLLRGDANLRADEELVWWYGDDDLEWRAVAEEGTVRVGGVHVEHLSPNGSLSDPALAEQTVRDRDTFVAKWGQPPW